MQLIMNAGDVEKRRADWLDVRRAGIGGSDIAAIMGVPSAYSTATAIYYDKTDGYEQDDNLSMRIGRHFESLVGEIFAEQHPELAVIPGGLYASDERPWAMATFDLLACTPPERPKLAGAVQIKTAARYDDWGPDGSDEIPPHYLAQVLWEMYVAETQVAWVPVLFTQSRQIRTYRVDRDADADADIKAMLAEAEDFLARVALQDPPPVDWRPQTTQALKRIYAGVEDSEVVIPVDLAERLRAAKRGQKRYERMWGLAENELRARLRDSTRALTRDGAVVATRSVFPVSRIDSKALRAAHPAIAAECTKTTLTDRLNLKGV